MTKGKIRKSEDNNDDKSLLKTMSEKIEHLVNEVQNLSSELKNLKDEKDIIREEIEEFRRESENNANTIIRELNIVSIERDINIIIRDFNEICEKYLRVLNDFRSINEEWSINTYFKRCIFIAQNVKGKKDKIVSGLEYIYVTCRNETEEEISKRISVFVNEFHDIMMRSINDLGIMQGVFIDLVRQNEKEVFEEISQKYRDVITESSQGILECCTQLEKQARRLRSPKILRDVANTIPLLKMEESRVLSLTFDLKSLSDKPGADRKTKLDELDRVRRSIDEYFSDAHKKIETIINEMTSIVDKRNARMSKMMNIFHYIVFIIFIAGYVLLQLEKREIPNNPNKWIEWVIVLCTVTLLFIYIYFIGGKFLESILLKLNDRKSMKICIIIFSFLASFLISTLLYYYVPKALYNLISPIALLLSQNNAFFTFFANLSALLFFIPLLIYSIKIAKRIRDGLFSRK